MRGAFGKLQGTCAHGAIGQVLLYDGGTTTQIMSKKLHVMPKFKFPVRQKIIVSRK